MNNKIFLKPRRFGEITKTIEYLKNKYNLKKCKIFRILYDSKQCNSYELFDHVRNCDICKSNIKILIDIKLKKYKNNVKAI